MDTAGMFELPSDLVDAVRRVFLRSEVDDVLGWLRRAESDRIAVAVLVGATCGAKPDARRIRQGIELSYVDFRDVLMNEYERKDRLQGSSEAPRPTASVPRVADQRSLAGMRRHEALPRA